MECRLLVIAASVSWFVLGHKLFSRQTWTSLESGLILGKETAGTEDLLLVVFSLA